MSALIIESKKPENLKILASLAKMLGDNVKAVEVEEIEDLLFGNMMDKIKTGKASSREAIMQALTNQ